MNVHLLARWIQGDLLASKKNITFFNLYTCKWCKPAPFGWTKRKNVVSLSVNPEAGCWILTDTDTGVIAIQYAFSPVWKWGICIPVNCITGLMAKAGWLQNNLFRHWSLFTCQVTWQPSLLSGYLTHELTISSELPSLSSGSAAKENSEVTSCMFEVYAYIYFTSLP